MVREKKPCGEFVEVCFLSESIPGMKKFQTMLLQNQVRLKIL